MIKKINKLQKPKYCRWCKGVNLIFKANHEHWEDNEYDDVWLCTDCNTIYGDGFFEYRVADIQKEDEEHNLKAANSFSMAVSD